MQKWATPAPSSLGASAGLRGTCAKTCYPSGHNNDSDDDYDHGPTVGTDADSTRGCFTGNLSSGSPPAFANKNNEMLARCEPANAGVKERFSLVVFKGRAEKQTGGALKVA